MIDITDSERASINDRLNALFAATTDGERNEALNNIGFDVRVVNVATGQPLPGKHRLVRGGALGIQLIIDSDEDLYHDGRPLTLVGFNDPGADGLREVLVSFESAGGAA